jgi:hypothetical protein
MNYEYVEGYRIAHLVSFDNGFGFAFGIKDDKLSTWQFTTQNGKRTFYSGRFFERKTGEIAELDFMNRIEEYIEANPGVEEI